MRFYIFSVLFFICFSATGQKKYTLSGQVTDSLTGKPLKGAVVQIAGTAYRDTSNFDGFYKITHLQPGTNNLMVALKSYDTAIIKFVIKADMKLSMKLYQKPDTTPKKTEQLRTDSVKKDSVPAANAKKDKDKREQKEKKTGKPLEISRDTMEVLIEDIIDFSNIFFSETREKRGKYKAIGYFTTQTETIYEFEAVFIREEKHWLLDEFNFKKKGKK